MKSIVGIGNPGARYQRTRHNVGFRVLDRFARQHGAETRRTRFLSQTSEAVVGGQRVLMLWPQTYVNVSGEAAVAALQWYRLSPLDLMVVCDDFHLALGHIRVRRKGSAGGHKGIASIIAALGTSEFPRIRVGIGIRTNAPGLDTPVRDPAESVGRTSPPGHWRDPEAPAPPGGKDVGPTGPARGFVLSPFREEELDTAERTIERTADALNCWLEHGLEECMNRFNAPG